ncbi:MAG: 3'-5' exonuclease [Bacteroidaceae bacterium]|nr:3'-5' exonuclease [Bacteroidaceae bacterium]MBP5322824.1 3'-5' exonuclease [Bacteroidaceae bacterium]
MELNITKPVVFFDLETTGTSVTNDRIVEISYLKVFPDGREISKTSRVNPGMPIPPQATSVHHISDEDVKDCPTFAQIAREIANVFEGSDIAGFNSNRFDIPMLAEEFLRAGVDFDFSKHRFIDVQVIFHKMEQRTLTAAYKFYCGKDLDDAHSAAGDTRATYEVLKAQLDRYDNLQNDVKWLSDYTSFTRNVDFSGHFIYDDNGKEIINFGKYKGRSLAEVIKRDPSYYDWIMKSDFPLNTKQVLTKIRLRELNH